MAGNILREEYGNLTVAAHIADSLPDEEWTEYVEALKRTQEAYGSARELVLNLSRGGPNAAQRKYVAEQLDPRAIETAVLSGNFIVRGMVTALGWLRLSTIRAFPPEAYDQAAAHLGIEGSLRVRVRAKIEEFRTMLTSDADYGAS
jgi:hypothetical protein